jgi:hypothetical protein
MVKNVILHKGLQVGSFDDYLQKIGMPVSNALPAPSQYARDLFLKTFAGDDAKLLKWDGAFAAATAALEDLVYCRENLLNEAFQVKPGERMVLPLVLDGTLADADLMVMGAGLSARLYRPDGTEVALEWLGDSRRSRDPTVWYSRIAGGGTELYSFRGQQPGTWQLIVDGMGLAAAVWGKAIAFGTSDAKLKTDVPKIMRPGEPVSVTAQMADWGSLAEPPSVTFRITRPGDLFAIGNRVVDSAMTAMPVTDGLTNYSHTLSIIDIEGRIPYRLLLSGKDKQGNPVSREASGDFFVKGDEPVIIPLPPSGDEPTEYPVISAIVADDVKLNTYGIKVDGSMLSPMSATKLTAAEALALIARLTPTLALPPQGGGDWAAMLAGKRDIRLLSGTALSPLSQGAHTVEVTATDTIAQAAAPEVWCFRVGRSLIASDPLGDDKGPGWYSYPTDTATYPAGAFDLEGFRVTRNGERLTVTWDLSFWQEAQYLTDLAKLPAVLDVYLDTDGIAGSGATALLPGRNANLRVSDAWEYCVTVSRDGALLIRPDGSTTPLEAKWIANRAAVSVTLDGSLLGITDPKAPDGWGYLVAVMGYDGLNAGHVKEVTTLGGAEGTWDPGIIV